jgi:hypothetical protein
MGRKLKKSPVSVCAKLGFHLIPLLPASVLALT